MHKFMALLPNAENRIHNARGHSSFILEVEFTSLHWSPLHWSATPLLFFAPNFPANALGTPVAEVLVALLRPEVQKSFVVYRTVSVPAVSFLAAVAFLSVGAAIKTEGIVAHCTGKRTI